MIDFSDLADHAREMLASDPLPVVDSRYLESSAKDLHRLSEDFFDSALHGAYNPFQLFGMGAEIDIICREKIHAYECQSQFVKRISEKRVLEWFCCNPATGSYSSVSNPDAFEERISVCVSSVVDTYVPKDSADSAHSTASVSGSTPSLTTAPTDVQLGSPSIDEGKPPEVGQYGDIRNGASESETGRTWEGGGSSQPAATGYQKSRMVNSWLETVAEPSNAWPVVCTRIPASTSDPPSSIWDITPKTPFASPGSCHETSGTSLDWFASEAEASFVLGDTDSPFSYRSGLSDVMDCVGEIARSVVNAYITQSATIACSVAMPSGPSFQRCGATSTHSPAVGDPPMIPKNRTRAQPGRVGGCSQTASTTGASCETEQSTRSTSNTTSRTADKILSRKRGVPENNEDAEEDALQGSKYPKSVKSSPSEADYKLLACPYFKFDQQRYSTDNAVEINYRKCSSCCLRGIPRLKQHLHRVHKRPDHYCPCCFAAFKLEWMLQAHIRSRVCDSVESPFEEKMTHDQSKAVKRRATGRDTRDAWYDIFKILFPGAPLPLSPYVESANLFTVNDFLAFFDSEAQGILSRAVNYRMLGYSPDNPGGFDAQFLEGVWTESLSILIQYLEDRVQQSSGNPDD